MNDLINTAAEETTMETTMEETIDNTMETTMEETESAGDETPVAEEPAADAKVDRRKDNPGRKPQFSDKWGIIDAISTIGAANGRYHYNTDGATVSRVLTLQLVKLGFVEAYKEKVTEGRGRAKMFYRLTGKGKSYLALSARWKKPEETTPEPKAVEPENTMVEENTMVDATPELVPAE
jgi:hypothetical protein